MRYYGLCLAKVLIEGGELRETQVDIPVFDHIAGLYKKDILTLTAKYAYANDFKVRLRVLTYLTLD